MSQGLLAGTLSRGLSRMAIISGPPDHVHGSSGLPKAVASRCCQCLNAWKVARAIADRPLTEQSQNPPGVKGRDPDVSLHRCLWPHFSLHTSQGLVTEETVRACLCIARLPSWLMD